jgi:hypothetical protein
MLGAMGDMWETGLIPKYCFMKIKKCIPLRPYLKLSEATRVF